MNRLHEANIESILSQYTEFEKTFDTDNSKKLCDELIKYIDKTKNSKVSMKKIFKMMFLGQSF